MEYKTIEKPLAKFEHIELIEEFNKTFTIRWYIQNIGLSTGIFTISLFDGDVKEGIFLLDVKTSLIYGKSNFSGVFSNLNKPKNGFFSIKIKNLETADINDIKTVYKGRYV